MDLSEFLPDRSIEDILAERVRLTIGGRDYVLAALTIEENEAWLAEVDGELAGTLEAVGDAGDDVQAILAALTGDSDSVLELLISYDKRGVLPPLDELRREVTPMGAIRLALTVWRAANPKADIALAALLTSVVTPSVSPARTSGRRRPGGSRTVKSGVS